MRFPDKQETGSLLLLLMTVLYLLATYGKETGTDHYNRAIRHYHKGHYDQAISEFTKAIKIDPTNAYAYSARGAAYQRKGQYDQALADYGKAIEINPRHVLAHCNRGLIHSEKAEYDKAIAEYTRVLEWSFAKWKLGLYSSRKSYSSISWKNQHKSLPVR